jgi:hypothetical protein
MAHLDSAADLEFRKSFESCAFLPTGFDHRAHLRLAYVYLVQQSAEAAYESMRDS